MGIVRVLSNQVLHDPWEHRIRQQHGVVEPSFPLPHMLTLIASWPQQEEATGGAWPPRLMQPLGRKVTATILTSTIIHPSPWSGNSLKTLAPQVAAKLEEGNFRGTVRITSSVESFGPNNGETPTQAPYIICILCILYPTPHHWWW